MEKFKLGDRVRIVCEGTELHGREGVIWRIVRAPHRKWGDDMKSWGVHWWHTAYLVDVDGVGRHWKTNVGWAVILEAIIGYPHFHLRPALRDLQAVEFMERIKRLEREPLPLVKEPVK